MRLLWPGSFSLRLAPLCLLAATAHADPGDTLQLSASYSITHDDNLFRLPKQGDTTAVIGRSSPAENIKAATGSLIFTKDYGLQHIDLNVNAVHYDYQNFSYLSFSAFNYAGTLKWRLTPRIRGNVVATRKETLAGFGDFRNFGQRNQRVETITRADGIYELDGAWQLTGGASRYSLENSATFIEQRSNTINSADVGIKRVFGSGGEASYRLRKGSGDFSAVSFADAGFLPQSFDETENELRLLWLLSTKTSLDTRISYLQRKYSTFAFRDFNGVVLSSNFNWGITAQTFLRAILSRDLGDYQSLYSSYTTTDRIVLEPAYRIKEKLTLKFRQEAARRNFNGGPIPGYSGQTGRDDKNYSSRLSVEWQPREQIDLSAWVQRDKRTSNFSGFDFTSNSVGLLAQLTF